MGRQSYNGNGGGGRVTGKAVLRWEGEGGRVKEEVALQWEREEGE